MLQLRAWVPTPEYLPTLRDLTEKAKLAINKMLSAEGEHAQVELAADPHTQNAGERTPDLT
jgi:small conductance mechanosensitive channel